MVEEIYVKKKKKNPEGGVPLWCIRLSIQHCHYSSSGCCCGMGSIPGPGISTCCRQKKKKKKKKSGEEDKSIYNKETKLFSFKRQTYAKQVSLFTAILKRRKQHLFRDKCTRFRFLFCFVFNSCTCSIRKFKSECQLQPTPQPQQHQILNPLCWGSKIVPDP